MMEEFQSVDFSVEASEGGLKELVRRWFTDTQASHILHDGNFPDWFQGFAARKYASSQLFPLLDYENRSNLTALSLIFYGRKLMLTIFTDPTPFNGVFFFFKSNSP